MKQRTYHREELDTTDEIMAEFQKLRNEAVADNKATVDVIENLQKRVSQLENPPKVAKKSKAKKSKAKKSSAKNKKK